MTIATGLSRDSRPTFLYACLGAEVIIYLVDTETAVLNERNRWVAPGNVQYACFDAERSLMYLATSDGGPADQGAHHSLVVVRLDRETGAIDETIGHMALPFRPLHVTLSPDKTLVATTYNKPSTVTMHRLDVQGAIGEQVLQPETIDIGICAHQTRFTPSGAHVLVCERGTDHVGTAEKDVAGAIHVFACNEGRLSFVGKLGGPAGSGFEPRNLDFDPRRERLYLVLESQNELITYAHRDGVPETPLFATSLLDPALEPKYGQVGGAVHVHPNGRFIYVSNRAHGKRMSGDRRVCTGGQDSIVVFTLDDDSSASPRPVQYAPVNGIGPRTFSFDRDVRVLAAGSWMKQWIEDGRGNLVPIMPCIDMFRIRPDGRLEHAGTHRFETNTETLFWVGMM